MATQTDSLGITAKMVLSRKKLNDPTNPPKSETKLEEKITGSFAHHINYQDR